MKDKKSKRSKKKLNLFFIAFLTFLLFFSVVIARQFVRIHHNAESIKQLTAILTEKEIALERLDDLKEIYSSNDYIEKIARERLGLVFPNEKIFIDLSRANSAVSQ